MGSLIASQNWKVQIEANADLASFLNNSIHDPPDLRLKQFRQSIVTLADSNAPVQDKALDALISFLRVADAETAGSDFVKYFREDLHILLLSFDFKKQIDGLNLLLKSLPASAEEIIGLLDILLKWVVLRFCDANTA
ncbi:hypothetical protein Syun_027311 [Stephania yunnanensis]|uniref:XMAP215/Dis1/CLASP TOG domain-containing protein n=1 Tax=Stephania yunnanensis TaxID=152371 RepID=A0AAP0HR62_9MAGN